MVFVFLTMALGGIAALSGAVTVWSLLAAAVGVSLLCLLGFRGKLGQQNFVQVELEYGRQRASMLALCDTGNTLRDPVTGQSVLIVDPRIAGALLGLEPQQLRRPVETVATGVIPGLRLVPYRAVGQAGGMLLAMRFENVKIGSRRQRAIVAFAPEGLGEDQMYQALTGG